MSNPPLSQIPIDTLYSLLRPVTVPSTASRARFINWGLSFECTPLTVFEPESEYQCELILELARREGKRVRAAGVGHSPSDLACTTDFMLRTEKLNKVIEVRHLFFFICGYCSGCLLCHFVYELCIRTIPLGISEALAALEISNHVSGLSGT